MPGQADGELQVWATLTRRGGNWEKRLHMSLRLTSFLFSFQRFWLCGPTVCGLFSHMSIILLHLSWSLQPRQKREDNVKAWWQQACRYLKNKINERLNAPWLITECYRGDEKIMIVMKYNAVWRHSSTVQQSPSTEVISWQGMVH